MKRTDNAVLPPQFTAPLQAQPYRVQSYIPFSHNGGKPSQPTGKKFRLV